MGAGSGSALPNISEREGFYLEFHEESVHRIQIADMYISFETPPGSECHFCLSKRLWDVSYRPAVITVDSFGYYF